MISRKYEKTIQSTKYFFGIDESNHGRIPEILVATFSTNRELVVKSRFPKIKKGERGIINLLSEGIDFRFTLLDSEKSTKALFKPEVRAHLIYELISSFDIEDRTREIYVDGYYKNLQERLNDIFIQRNLEKPNRIISEPKADITYKIVNAADTIARALFQAYSRSHEIGIEKYLDKKIHTSLL